ncbi:hypothetical protein B0T26DRAFT_745998 [Lasiosphaeria miniovina]|uniref:Gamma-glutamylcyclotransferase AIG2-like domain-containing protein n=1 Tax=Lasiosphaeria miniovina TaxID=1954250 RepID=A0AA40BGY0_9PEZI|nr:uncharacterized protein B0T26DRAFT_745998 [Lasiosphaeria miniovina]KAK0734041.1 hypothetical protein B0T26DRAFT_745998 [Lasiosphaeria miniovina]
MAQAASFQPSPEDEPDHDTVKRWQALLGYTYPEAAKEIRDKRRDLGRPTLSEASWETLPADKRVEGFDKEAYEHACWLAKSLQGPLTSPETLQAALGLDATPAVLSGSDDFGELAAFCKVAAVEKQAILCLLSDKDPFFQPTFVRCSVADKVLSAFLAHPTLGIDATLPQHRTRSPPDPALRPAQGEYPVWYFFYGTLADPNVLRQLLELDREPTYRPAKIHGGLLEAWAGKYRALEEALCRYETDQYEVVRCEIEMERAQEEEEEEETIRGLTFRFVGEVD